MKLLPLALLAALASSAAFSQPASCSMSQADREWAESALRNWRVVEREALMLRAVPYPGIVMPDAQCTSAGTEARPGAFAWRGTPHSGTVQLPDGNKIPIGTVSFAAPDPSGRRAAFFVMSTPSVWRDKGVKSALGLETLMDAVLLHEMAHTRQFEGMSPQLEQLTSKYGLPDDINDDSLQDAFSGNAAYVRDYEAERDLLFAAAGAPTEVEARKLAGDALALMRARRDRWFTGAAEKWRGLDEVFLTMEGLGQWVAYWWLTAPQGRSLDRATAEREMRRGGKRWTQDEGLALFLVVDRLVPGWQARVFGEKPAMAEELLLLASRAK